jgi:ribosomal protein L37AE/L43A
MIELLPPNKKFECPDCKKKFRKLEKCKDGIKRCKMCKRKLITNKFYVPIENMRERRGIMGKFSMTKEEIGALYKNAINSGKTPEQASKMVSEHIKMLRQMKMKKREIVDNIKNRKIKESELNKKFKEGLK